MSLLSLWKLMEIYIYDMWSFLDSCYTSVFKLYSLKSFQFCHSIHTLIHSLIHQLFWESNVFWVHFQAMGLLPWAVYEVYIKHPSLSPDFQYLFPGLLKQPPNRSPCCKSYLPQVHSLFCRKGNFFRF